MKIKCHKTKFSSLYLIIHSVQKSILLTSILKETNIYSLKKMKPNKLLCRAPIK